MGCQVKSLLEFLIAYSFKFLLWFRYRIKIVGLEKLTPEVLSKPGGVLFLPNHPTYFIDPIVHTLAIWPKYVIRPMIVEYMYYAPIIHPIMKFLDALPIPNFNHSSNSLKRHKSEMAMQEVVKGLKAGSNFMVYPGGGVKHTAYEAIGGASGAHRIIQEAPEANVVLMRAKGLWGSSFSRAILTNPQTVGELVWSSLKIILKNLIFFTPRREIIVEIEPAPADFPWNATRLEFNRYLEHWYNRPDGLSETMTDYPGDTLVLVSYSRWRDEFLQPKAAKELQKEFNLSDIPPDVRDKVLQKLAEISEMKSSAIQPDMNLATDLGLDSLDGAELVAFLNDEFEVTDVSVKELTTVGQLMALASKKLVFEKQVEDKEKSSEKWEKLLPHEHVRLITAKTIHETFLNTCQRRGNQAACVDQRAGVLTYANMKLRAILLAEKIRKLPGEYIGIMLPASVAADLTVFATLLAGKVPVMINWTVGPRHLESVVSITKLQVVLSSWAFLDRLENVNLDAIEKQLVMLEDVARNISVMQKTKGVFLAKRGTKAILKHFGSDKVDEHDRAVVLFTSGTESVPKGVPLTHHNILNNLRPAIDRIDLFQDDIIYGILPPFHSFGFSVSTLLGPMLGIRVAYSPNPTDGLQLAAGIKAWKPTLLVGAPTFLKTMLRACDKEDLKQVRLLVTGAEKATPDLFKLAIDKIGKEDCVLEGYGITECSPALTFNPQGEARVGVGQPIDNVELIIVQPETLEILPTGEQGMILVRGPNIFSGYLNPGLSSPFVTVEGKEWYKTGDLGFVDEKRNLTIGGRLKRFVKIGGEMVSLAAVEEAVQNFYREKGNLHEEGPAFAICAKEDGGDKAKIYLFTLHETSLDEANKALREGGFSNLVRISSIIKVGEIPLMGTGKINYRALEGQYLA